MAECFGGLTLDPVIDVSLRIPPHSTHLELRNFLGLRQPVDRPFLNLEIARDFLDGENVFLASPF